MEAFLTTQNNCNKVFLGWHLFQKQEKSRKLNNHNTLIEIENFDRFCLLHRVDIPRVANEVETTSQSGFYGHEYLSLGSIGMSSTLTATLYIHADEGKKIPITGALLSCLRRQLGMMHCVAEGCRMNGTFFGMTADICVQITRVVAGKSQMGVTSPATRIVLELDSGSLSAVLLDAPAQAMLISASVNTPLSSPIKNKWGNVATQSQSKAIRALMAEIEEQSCLTDPFRQLIELIMIPMLDAPAVEALGYSVLPKGLLLSGPPGVGKTYSVKRACDSCTRLGLPVRMFSVAGAELLGYGIGEGEAEIKRIFQYAEAYAHDGVYFLEDGTTVAGSSIIFLDEADALFCKRDDDNGGGSRTRILAQLLLLMDGFSDASSIGENHHLKGHVLVVGATNRPNQLDPALRRPGRFDLEITLAPPSELERQHILASHLKGVPLHPDLCLNEIAKLCTGYVGADIAALAREASLYALRRTWESCSNLGEGVLMDVTICTSDMMSAMEKTGASALRGYKVQIPTTKWSDIGGLHEVKLRLQQTVEWPITHHKAFHHFNLSGSRGTLLYGPPGCCKTVLARACASESGATFVSLSGADVYSPYVGDAEATVRKAFQVARSAPPAILFFDEIDGIVGNRQEGNSVSNAEARVLSTFLNEMDGVDVSCDDQVVVIGATNRPWHLDAAILRPGRFDNIIYVPIPDLAARTDIFHIHTRKMPLDADVSLEELAQRTEGYSGSEIEGICKESALNSLREDINCVKVHMRHFVNVIKRMTPFCSQATCSAYTSFSKNAMHV